MLKIFYYLNPYFWKIYSGVEWSKITHIHLTTWCPFGPKPKLIVTIHETQTRNTKWRNKNTTWQNIYKKCKVVKCIALSKNNIYISLSLKVSLSEN